MAVTRVTKNKLAHDVWNVLLGYTVSQGADRMIAARRLGLNPGDVRALFALDTDKSLSMGGLAAVIGCDVSRVTWLVDRLEERGLVQRRAYPQDRRVRIVVLTPVGIKTKARLVELLSEPPSDLVALDRANLDQLRGAIRLLPPHPPFWMTKPCTQDRSDPT